MTNKRLYVGGLTEGKITKEQLENRFSPFGLVSSVEFVPERTFAYVQLTISEENLKKCINIYNKSKWMGMKLRIEEAKKHYLTRLKEEWEAQKQLEIELKKNELKKIEKKELILKEREQLVTEENVDGKVGWKRSRYGRAVCVMKLKKTGTRQIKTYDPSRYKLNITKFKFKNEDIPISNLTLLIDGHSSIKLSNPENIKEPTSKVVDGNLKIENTQVQMDVTVENSNVIKPNSNPLLSATSKPVEKQLDDALLETLAVVEEDTMELEDSNLVKNPNNLEHQKNIQANDMDTNLKDESEIVEKSEREVLEEEKQKKLDLLLQRLMNGE
ncbi:nucleolar protein 8 [Clydaea vesicula]|uniref:Nucleolar protein 8 n=1 Tax=Clydaea vesicula TaxID=447962 RepID=A0AAD5U798_9FUNG|nr:nucleolar protein 8 [Clydaea vesicula]